MRGQRGFKRTMRGQRGFRGNKIWPEYLKVVTELPRSNEEENQTYLSSFIRSQTLHPATKLTDLISKLWINKTSNGVSVTSCLMWNLQHNDRILCSNIWGYCKNKRVYYGIRRAGYQGVAMIRGLTFTL